MLEMTTCTHKETIRHIDYGIDEGTCRLCGQVRHYDSKSPGSPAVIKVLGRINGKIVAPNALDKLDPSVQAQLDEATVLAAKVTEVSVKEKVKRPRLPKKRRRQQEYFEQHKEAILKDYFGMLLKDFYREWQISTNTWIKLKKLWGVTPKRQPRKAPPAPPVPPSPQTDGLLLPSFPAFKDSWGEAVQIEWFKTYRAIRLATKQGGKDEGDVGS